MNNILTHYIGDVMNKHLGIIAATLCIVPHMAYADNRTAQDTGTQSSTTQREVLQEQFKMLLLTEALRIRELQNTALAPVTIQALTQNLMKVQREIRELKAQLNFGEIDALEKQVAALQQANQPQQSKLETLLAQERNRTHQLETQLDTLSPEQFQALQTDLERIQSEIKQVRAQNPTPKVAEEVADLEEQYKSALDVKRLSETLINTLMAKDVRNSREENELAISLRNLDSANAAIQKLEAKQPSLSHSAQPQRHGAVNPHAKALLSNGLTSMTESLDFDPSAPKTPAAPRSSPADLDSEYIYVNGLGNAHLTTENMPMDDLAKALAISAKEAQAAQAERKPTSNKSVNSAATATSSAEADVKRRAPEHPVAPQSTAPTRPATRGAFVSKTTVDTEHNPLLKRALQESMRSISTQPTEVQKKETGAAHSSSAAVAPKPQQTLRPIIETADSDLELALAMSLESQKTEALKRLEQTAQPQPVAAPVSLSASVDLDDVGPMFGASNPRETGKPLNHLRRPTFKGRKKLTAEQISTLADQLRLAHALKLSQ
jgi:hypothetical protein